AGGRGEGRGREDLSTGPRQGQGRLEGAVVTLGGDDVAGDERRYERERPERHEEEDDEGDGDSCVADRATEWDVVRAPFVVDDERDHECGRHQHRGTQPEVCPFLREQL